MEDQTELSAGVGVETLRESSVNGVSEGVDGTIDFPLTRSEAGYPADDAMGEDGRIELRVGPELE